jgi:N-acyl homoserine lactone hydrolase
MGRIRFRCGGYRAVLMRVELLHVGWVTAPAGIWRRGDDLERPARLPVPAYLIETERERILVDTGVHPDAVADPERRYGRPNPTGRVSLGLDRSVAEQVDFATLTRVVMTHLHFDHAGALALLPAGIPIVVQRREWEAAHDAAAIERNFYLPADYAHAAERVTLVDGDHDLLGDGSIRLLLTPGHTPGHQSLLVGERLLLGGDVAHFASGLDDLRFPAFGDDPAAQAASASRLRVLRDGGARFIPGHDPEVLRPGEVEPGDGR